MSNAVRLERPWRSWPSTDRKHRRVYEQAWRERNRHRYQLVKRKYRQEHLDAVRAYQREYARKWRAQFPEKSNGYSKKWKLNHPQETIASQYQARLRRVYGLKSEWYTKTLKRQGGVCAICRANHPGKGKTHFHVDHNHKTGIVRGLLCCSCNLILGRLNDNPAFFRGAALYLTKHQKHHEKKA